jgi:hypothetical protein
MFLHGDRIGGSDAPAHASRMRKQQQPGVFPGCCLIRSVFELSGSAGYALAVASALRREFRRLLYRETVLW